jgi:cell pole-organizing protein PopZ
MTQPAKSQEPSMEEILASIRRIIADDDANKTAQRPAEPAPPKAAAPAPRPAAPPLQRVPAPPPRVAPPEPSLTDEAGPEMDMAGIDPAGGRAADDQSSDILDLTESMTTPALDSPASATPQFRTIDGNFDVSYEETVERPAAPAPEPHYATERHHYGDGTAQLLSNATSAAVDSAFNSLAQTVLVQNGRTLEDLVREMLRPMLKSWLDDNLPGMVERLVRAEIERVSRGRMS